MHSFKLLFSAISMSTTRPLSDGDAKPSELKCVKTLCCQKGSDWSWGGGGCFSPSENTLQTHRHVFSPVSFQLQVRRKYRNEQRGGERTEERKQRKQVWVVLCLSFTLSAGSQQMGFSVGGAESWDPPPSLVRYHTHPEEGLPTPQTLICEEKKMPTASVYRTVDKHSWINRDAEE